MRTTPVILVLLLWLPVRAETISIAVASNFVAPMADLVSRFERDSGHTIRTSAASTGVLYASISNGAPYAALFAADEQRPHKLEDDGAGVAGSRFAYAVGRLEVWSMDPGVRDCRAALDRLGSRHLAIANPATAPYGAAARSFLQNAGLWDTVSPNLVFGQNITQTLQFVVTRNASLGIVAAAHTGNDALPEPTCRWPVPASMHEPIVQQAILLEAGADSRAAKAFMAFVGSDEGKAIIRAHGYEVPD